VSSTRRHAWASDEAQHLAERIYSERLWCH
jgi:hypothetical protein